MAEGRNRDADADDVSWTDMSGEVRPDLVEAMPIRHGMVLGGRYVIEKIIGRGASGVVVRAHDSDLRQRGRDQDRSRRAGRAAHVGGAAGARG